ncbi:MAG: hypothetical protein ACYSW7_09175, partial [Planctomycetota bacterium]
MYQFKIANQRPMVGELNFGYVKVCHSYSLAMKNEVQLSPWGSTWIGGLSDRIRIDQSCRSEEEIQL